jgi:cytochrome c553
MSPKPRLAPVLLVLLLGTAAGGAAAAGDAAAGKARSQPCAACHGADGNAVAETFPTLAGQNARYLLNQLQMIRSGARPAPLMAGQLTGMSDQDLEDLAAFFSAQKANVGEAKDDVQLLAQGQAIYRSGIGSKQVTACIGCHAPNGGGNAPAGFPQVRGLAATYVVDQLKAYREGVRRTDEAYGGMMREVAARMTDGEIQAVANYVHGLMD